LEGQFFNFKSAGKGGGVTGKGGNILLIDDPVKSAKEAFNERQLESDWLWYTGTWISRKEAGALEIINHTPWSKNDIGGKLQTLYPEECYVFKKQAYDEKENKMLCESILSLKEYAILKKTMNSIIFAANYMLERVEIKGLLYNKEWKIYSKLPVDELGRELVGPARLWCDTADKGADYLCAITGRIYDQYVYITDVYYTKSGVEITEPEIARRIVSNKVRIGRFEANAGGSVIAKHIDLLLRKEYKWIGSIVMFDQTGNKRARMLAEAGTVQDRIIFPADWDQRWPDFHLDVITFKKEGTNDHDDAPDTLTQIVEEMATDIVDKQTASEMAARRRSGR
jgi:predicted phage terminase large subunit-like protein